MKRTNILDSIASWLVVGAMGLAVPASADEVPETESPLGVLKSQFEELRADALSSQEKFDARYLEQLKALEKAAAEKGNLNLVLAVRKETEEFRDRGIEAGKTEHPELARLQEIYAAETARIADAQASKLAGLVAGYRKQLVDLRSELTKAGKIEEATAVQAEVDRIEREHLAKKKVAGNSEPGPTDSGKGEPAPKDKAENPLEGTIWKLVVGKYEGARIEFYEEGRMRYFHMLNPTNLDASWGGWNYVFRDGSLFITPTNQREREATLSRRNSYLNIPSYGEYERVEKP